MAKNKRELDRFANRIYAQVTESVAGTLAFSEINTNMSIFDKQAFVLHRLEYYPRTEDLNLMVSNSDYIEYALTASNTITTLDLANPAVIDVHKIGCWFSTAVGHESTFQPFSRDFTGLPGGGLICAPRPLYLAARGISLAATVQVTMRAYFSILEMSAEDYLDLVDFYRVLA